ncbi:MAG: PaaI family thioesterase [Magnetospirillum sp.]
MMENPRPDPGPDWKPLALSGLMAHIGPLMARRDGEFWRYGLMTTHIHANMLGIVHGGTYATLADHAMSVAAWETTGRDPVVTLELSTQFIASARPGDFLEVCPRLIARSGGMLYLDAVMSADGRVLAAFSGIWKHVKAQSGGRRHDA